MNSRANRPIDPVDPQDKDPLVHCKMEWFQQVHVVGPAEKRIAAMESLNENDFTIYQASVYPDPENNYELDFTRFLIVARRPMR